jgi:hypothetical protein
VFITAFGSAEDPFPELEPLTPGQIVPPSTDVAGEQQFNVVIERGTDGGEEGGDLYNSSSGPEGSLEVLAVDDESICVAIDYTDYEGASSTNGVPDEYPLQKRLVATFAAPVVEF